jgi:FkbH-like protein
MTERVYLVADFNVETLARYLANTTMPGAKVQAAPFGQVRQTLSGTGPGSDWNAVVWTRADATIDAFRRAVDFEQIDADQALTEVNAFAESLKRFAKHVRCVFVPTWTLPWWSRGYGMLELRRDIGLAHLLSRMNLALADALAEEPSVFVLDAQRWFAAAGSRAVTLKPWYAAKTPFAPAVFEQAGVDLSAALNALAGRARRLIILDLDEVLWGGIVGEVGWEGITLGGHDYVGEAFVDFQRTLKALTHRGIQLAIASKNDEAVALEVFDRHPEMVLKRDDFVAWRINWSDKAQNVTDLLREVNLGAESAVFIDDSPIERARVATAVPGVVAPEWPEDPTRYRETLSALPLFDTPHLTVEDRQRSKMYAVERTRKQTQTSAGDLDEWLQSLDITVSVETLTAANLARATQLLNKTNQLNMTTRRLAPQELEQWASLPDNLLLTFRVADRFGDSGLTGIAGLTFAHDIARLTDFLLSCRVMGRSVEETMLHAAVAQCRARGAASLVAEFIPTARNAPCLEFLQRSGLKPTAPNEFRWVVSEPYPLPHWVRVDDRTDTTSTAAR